ncbi:MAG: mRNA surveillance protein pelota [Methanobacteriota archaeon]|nr:MAG: mRNA surveillance protein pelota [Euryarchaeota archaeon]
MKMGFFRPPELQIVPETDDDLYILSNAIRIGDKVIGRTTRKIKHEATDTTKRESVTLGIEVEAIEYKGYGDHLRLRGPIFHSSDPNISLSSYHSLTVKPKQKITIIREKWENKDLEDLNNPSDRYLGHIILVSIDDEEAVIAQLGRFATQILTEISSSIPRKVHQDQHREMKLQFFSKVAETLKDLNRSKTIRKIVIGGPGFVREEFLDFLREKFRDLAKNTVSVPLKNSGRGGIKELINADVLSNFDLTEQVKKESQFMDAFLEELSKDGQNVVYGIDQVTKAVELGAVDQLAVVDIFMKKDPQIRKKIEQLLIENSRFNGKNIVVSNDHPFSEQLLALGGIGAILRFPLP